MDQPATAALLLKLCWDATSILMCRSGMARARIFMRVMQDRSKDALSRTSLAHPSGFWLREQAEPCQLELNSYDADLRRTRIG